MFSVRNARHVKFGALVEKSVLTSSKLFKQTSRNYSIKTSNYSLNQTKSNQVKKISTLSKCRTEKKLNYESKENSESPLNFMCELM